MLFYSFFNICYILYVRGGFVYKFNENLYKKTKKPSLMDFVFIPLLLIIIIFVLLNLKNKTGNDKNLYLLVLFMSTIFLLLILFELLVPKRMNPLTKKLLKPEIDKLINEGKSLEAIILDNSVEFRGIMKIAVRTSSNNYVGKSFSEIIIDFNEISEVLIRNDNVIINYKKGPYNYNFGVSNYFENSIDFAQELKEKLIRSHESVHFNY